MISRNEILVRRAAKDETNWGRIHGIDFEKSAVETIEGMEFVALRSKATIRNKGTVVAVFEVDGWNAERLDYDEWPNCLLDELMSSKPEKKKHAKKIP